MIKTFLFTWAGHANIANLKEMHSKDSKMHGKLDETVMKILQMFLPGLKEHMS